MQRLPAQLHTHLTAHYASYRTAYNEAQAAVEALRPHALIKAVRTAILYSTYDMDPPSQRRILRNYGTVYRYLPGEVVDVGDETAVVGEGV